MEFGPDGSTNIKVRDFYGNKPREIAARQLFPILIEFANSGPPPNDDPLTYEKLADEILEYIPLGSRSQPGTKAKWMAWPLGNIWHRLYDYQQESDIDIPYLTVIVVSKRTGQPTHFSNLGKPDDWIQAEQEAVYTFKQWEQIRQAIEERGA